MAHGGQEETVGSDGSFENVGNVAFLGLWVVIGHLLTGEFHVRAEVEVGTAVDALQLFEPEGKIELDICGCVGVVGQVVVVVKAEFLSGMAKGFVPFQAGFFPLLVPFLLGTGLNEELHLHLLKLPHAEDELAGNDLVPESLTDLRDTEGKLLARAFLYVEEVNENTLGRFRAQVQFAFLASDVAELGGEHKVELAHVRPVRSSGFRVLDFEVDEDLPQLLHIAVGHGRCEAFIDLVHLAQVALHVAVGGAVFCFIESITEALFGLSDFFIQLTLNLGYVVLNQHIGAVALLA